MSLLLLLLACALEVQLPEDGSDAEVRIELGTEAAPAPAPEPETEPAQDVDPTVASMRAQPLTYTRHGACRMECRKIDEAEVQAILEQDGVLKPERTRTDGDCPTHALEGETRDGQNVRIVFAACADKTKVVTAIDLDTDWPCGDC